MKKNVFSIFSVLSVLAFLVTGLFTSCEVGLGEAVDTYPPTLTLDYPANDGITVMNTFQMRGEAKDETYVKTVDVIVKTIPKSNKETAKELIRYAAEIDSQAKTWSCAVNKKDENGTFQIPDGEYTFQIICTDSSDRTTELSRVYKIDNTAPVVVLKRPGLDDSYGRTIKVTGDISDENELSALYFTAYRNKGTEEAPDFELIGTQRYENISGVGLELIVGRYFDSEEGLSDNEKNQKAIYDAYYDSTIGGSQSFYCMVEVADSAKEYTGTLDLNTIPSGASADSLKPAAGSYTGEVSGNLSTCYYLYSSIYDDIYSKNGFNITNSDLVSIYNGSFTETSKVKIAKVKETLEKYAINTSAISASVSFFSLNPDNSPRFKVLGLGDASNVKSVIKNSDINIEISQGRDGISLRSNSIRVELQEAEALANGTYKKTGNNIVLLESYNKYTEMLSSDDASEARKGELYKTYWTSLKKDEDNVFNDEAAKITFGIELNGLSPLSEVYKTGKKYYVSVEGCDYEDNEIESAASDYILAFQNGSAPIINVTGGTEDNSVQRTPVDFSTSRSLSVSGAPIFNYSGTLDSDSGIEDLKVFYYITVKDEKPAKGETVKTWSTKKEDYADRTAVITENTDSSVEVPFLWSLEIPEGSEDFAELYEKAQADGKDLSDGLYLYTIYFYGYDGSQKTSTVSQRVHVDTQKPVVTMDGVTPLVEYEEASDLPYEDMAIKTDYVNGTVTFKGTVSDNYTLNNTIARAYLLEADGTKTSETAFATEEFGDSMSFSFVVDTSSVTEPKDMLVEIESTDKAGNTGDVVTKKVRIDQRTDEPRFIPSNADKTILDVTKLNESTNMFGKTSNNKIMGTVTDDDGVWGWQAYYSAGTSEQTASEWKLFASSTGIESTSANITVDLSKISGFTEGIYKIKIEVKDIVKGKGAVANSQISSSDEFFIAIDEAAPSLTITTEQNSYVSGTEGATVKGKISDGSQEIKSFKRTVYRVETTTNDETGESSVKETAISENVDILSKLSATSGSAIKNGLEFTDVIDLNGEENPGRVKYYITDKYDRESTAEFTYIIDNEDPTVSLSADLVDTTVFLAKGNAIKGISGTARDNIENGLSKVEYIISASETAAGITETDWTAFTGTYKWNSTINFGETTEGKKYVYIRAHDAAGNKTDAANYACIPVIIDAEAPVFDEDSFKVEYIDETGGAVPASEDGATRYANKLFKITGKVTDEYYKDLTCSIQTGTFDKTSLGETGGIFTWTLNGLTDGSKNYVFTATDQAGQTTTKTVTIVIDRTAPTPKLGLSSYYSLTGATYTVNEKITFTGSVTDANEVKSTVISAVKADDATEIPVTTGGILPITAANASNFTESFDTTALEDGVYIFTVTSTDVAGNVGTAQIRVSIDQETDKPLITFSNADSAVTVLSDVNEQRNLFGKTSNNKILGSVSDDDKVGTITVQYTTDFDHAAAEIPADSWHTIGTYTATGSTYNLSIELKDEDGNKLSEGDYRLRVIAEDSKNPEADGTVPASKQTIAGPFYIGIDEGLPVIDINRQDGEMLAAEQSVSVTGKVSDGSGVVTLSRYRQKVKNDGSLEDAREETTITSVTGNTNATEWTDNFTSLASSEVLTYKATDKYGRESTKSFKYQVDDADPTIVVAAPEADSFLGSAYGNTTKAFSGTAADTNGTGKSGVKEILYRVGTINGSSVDYGTALAAGTANWHDTWLKADGTTTWNANIELGNSSSKKKVQILAVDGADRISTIEERTVTVDAVIPVITINSVTDTVNAASRTVTAQEGTYYVQSGYTISGTITEENLDTLKIFGVLVTPVDNGDGTYSFSHSVTSPDVGQSTISIVALDKAGQQKDLSLNVFYDTSAPTPSFTITPILSAKGWDGTTRENNVNGNVTIKGTSVDDDKVASSHLVIKYANGAKAGVKVYDRDTTNPTNFTGDVPLSLFIEGDGYNYLGTTVKIDDRQLYTVELTSTDRAGRVGIATSEVYVDESTDKPIVTLSNTNVDINSAADVSSESGHNLFNQTSNSKMLGTITDDDGIASIVVEYAVVTNGTTASYETEPLFSVSNVGTTYNFASDLKKNGASLSEGKYKIRISVLDTTEAAANHKTVEEFFLAIDNGAPSITVSTGSGYMKNNFTVEGKVSDAALKSIYRYAVTQGILASTPSAKWEAGSASNTIEYNSTTKVWTDNYSGITEPGTVAYIAADEYGQSTEVSWSYLFDNTAPTKAPGWTPSDMSAWSKNSAQQFKIPVSDEWNVTGDYLYDSCSGISTVNIKVDSDDASTMALGSAYDEFEKTIQTSTGPEQVKPYKYYNSTQILKDGHHTVVISASDNANPANTAENLATYEVNIDTTAPKYTPYTTGGTDYVKASKALLTAADVAALGTTPFTLKVKPSDANASATGGAISGIKEFKLYDGNTEIPSANYTVTPDAVSGTYASGVEYTFEMNASAVNQTGNHNFYVETIDGAGNSVKESVSVSIDTTAPVISVNDPSPYVSVSGARKYNGIITISGKAEDETELGTTDALEYEVLSSAGASLSPRVTGTVDLTGGKSSDFSFDIDTTALTGSNATGTFKIKVTAKDKVQNTVDNSAALADGTSKLILSVDQTTDKPVVKLSNANVKVTTEAQVSSSAVTSETASENKGNLFGMGNDSIFASATDDDGIAGIELKVFYNGSYKTVHKVGDETKPYFEVTDSPTSYPMEIDLTKVLPQVSGSTTHYAGTYKLAIVVTDIYNTSTMSNRTFTVNDDGVNGVYFAYDDDLPVINVTKINTTNYTDSMWARPESAIYIEVSDSSSTDDHTNLTVVNETLQWWDKDLNKYVDGTRETGEAESAVWDSTAGAWRFDSKNIDKTYKRKFRVTDKYGRSANKEITYKVDTVNPVFNSAYIALYGSSPSIDASDSNLPAIGVVIGTSKDFWFNSDAVKVIGRGTSATETALKEENPETVTVSVGAAGSAGATDYPVNPGTYNKFSTTISFVDGENIVRFNAKDKAELSATEVQSTVKVDTKAPVVSSVTASTSNINRKAQAALDTTPFYITVAVADANESAVGGKVSGISGFKVYRGTDDITSLATVKTGTAASSAVAVATDGVFADGTYYIHLASEAMTTGTHTFYVEAVDNAGNSKKEGTEAVSIDVTSPTMSWNVPSPYVTVSSARKYNGIITVSGTVNDETLLATDDTTAAASASTRSVSWKVKTNEEAAALDEGYATLGGTKTSSFSFEIDTTKVQTESGNYRIYITAKDKVGNTVSKAGEGSGAGVDYIEIAIDQSTNKPKVSLSNMSIYEDPESETLVPVTAYDEEKKERNLFGMGSNTIYGTVSDDDGISSIVLKIDGTEVKKTGNKPYFDDLSGNPTSYTMQIDLSTINSGYVIGSGNHTLTIEVTDSSSSSLKDKTYIVNNDTVNGIYFAYDNDLPTISVVRCNDKDYTNNMWGKGEFDVYIQVSDASDIENEVNQHGKGLNVKCTEVKKNNTPLNIAGLGESDAEWVSSKTFGTGDEAVTLENVWKYTTKNSQGDFQRTFTVTDAYNRRATYTINYQVDTTLPEFKKAYLALFGSSPNIASSVDPKEGIVIGTSENYWFNSDAVKIIGLGSSTATALVEDKVETVTITVGSTPYPVNAGTYNKFSTTISFDDGQNSIQFDAVDKAGNEAVPVTSVIKVDTTRPVIESLEVSSNEINGAAKAALATTPFYITVNGASDANSKAVGGAVSGISSFKVYRGSDDITSLVSVRTETTSSAPEATATNGVYADGTYYIHIEDDALVTGSHIFSVEVIDLAGNVSSKASTETVNIDVTNPTMCLNIPSPYVSVKDGDNTVKKYNGTINISGTVTDETELASDNASAAASDTTRSVSWEVKTSAGESLSTPVKGYATLAGQKTSDFSFALNTRDFEASSGTYRVYIIAKDKVGNTTSSESYVEIPVDQNTDRPVITFNELTSASGTIRKYTTSISGMISDDDGIEEFYICEGNELEGGEWDYSTEPKRLESWTKYITYFKAKNANEQKEILDWTSNASFVYTPENDADGSHDLYFYIKDTNGQVFYTGKTVDDDSEISMPYIAYKAQEKGSNTSVISYNTDANPPTINVSNYATGTKTRAGVVTLGEYADSIPENFYAGGSNKAVLRIHISPFDELGIKSVTGTLGSNSITFTKQDNTDDWYYEAFVGKYSDGYVPGTDEIWATGEYSLLVVVTDNSDLTTQISRTLHVDNKAPSVTEITPSSTLLQSGDFSVQGYTEDEGGGKVAGLKYIVMNDTNASKTDAQLIAAIKADTTQTNTGSEMRFTFHFDGENNPKLPATAAEAAYYSRYQRDGSDYYDIPIYFLATDSYGNENLYKNYSVYYNPFVDRPSTTILTPSSGEAVSGSIRVSGSAEDDKEGIDSVYIQLDVNKDGSYNKADMSVLLGFGYNIYAVSTLVDDADFATYKANGQLSVAPFKNYEADSSFWGIKCEKTSSWYVNVNGDQLKLDAIKEVIEGEGNIYHLSVRAASLDKNGTLGSWTQKVSFRINDNIPIFGSKHTPEIKNVSTNDVKAYSSLDSSSYVSGTWKLLTSVTHSNGIKKISYVLNSGTTVVLVEDSAITSAGTGLVTEEIEETVDGVLTKTGYKLAIPIIDGEGEGTSTLVITAFEKQNGRSNNAIYSVNYDNLAPTIGSLEQNDEEWTGATILKNSNNSLTIGSTVTDGAAGLGKVLFYFYRNHGGIKRIYDVGMNIKDSNGDYTYSYTNADKTYPGIKVTGLSSYDSVTNGETYKTVGGQPMYGYKATGVTRGDSTTQISGVADNAHIRKGSLVLIGGSYHKITETSVSGGTMTITFSGECATTVTEAFFPYVMSVDNFNAETVKRFTAEDQTIRNDDGDNMPESISGMQASRTWSAQLHANWMPDGPITFVMFAFDGADNVVSEIVNCKLETSAPRLAKLHLGTDLNRSDTFTANEFETYNFLGVEGTYQDAVALTTKEYSEVIGGEVEASTRGAFKIKNKLAVIPEFTGGNGDIYAVLNNKDTTTTIDSEGFIDVPGYVSNTTTGTTGEGTLNPTQGTVDGLGKYYLFSNDAVGEASEDEEDYKTMSLTFWDSTDGLVAGDTSQKCFVSVRDFLVWTTDNINPNVVVDKFFWNGTGDGNNSLYQGSKDNGHIELEDDLTDAIKTLYGDDPKVSGKIVLRGSAYDDTFLKSIAFTMTNFNGDASNTIATYTDGAWVKSTNTIGSSPYYEVLSVEDEYFNQKGHKVNWAVAIDTAKLSDVAHLNAEFNVVAVDNATKTSADRTASEESADSVKHRPTYQMDVVPYITGVETSVSSFLSKDYTRSAVGDYPIKLSDSTGETIKVSGFNLNPTNKATDTNTVKSDVRLSNNKTALDGTTKKGTGLKVVAGSGDDAGKWLVTMSAIGNGYLTFFTNGIPSLNNVDSDVEYNKEDSLIHASLNNDRKFALWNFTALRSNDNAPKANGATYPSMAMNGDTPQFAYVNNVEGYGLAEFWNGTKETKIYENWDLFTYTALALNSSGKRAALYDINVVQGGTGYASDSGGIMTNFFNNPADSAWGSTCYYFRNNNVWLDGLYKDGVTAVLGRYQYPTIKMVGDESISHVFYSVYDSLEDRVVFRYFTVGTSNTLISNATAITSENSKVYMNKNQLNQVAVGGSWPNYTSTNNDNNRRFSNYGNYAGTSTTPQAFATGSTVGLYTATAGVPITTNNNGKVTAARGILIYYSGTNMYYTYATNNGNTSWSTPIVLDSNCEASYISVVVDGDKHVHIAYQNSIAGDVKYIYIPTYSDPATRKTVTVDSYLTVGDKLTLDVIGSTPYIGYKGLGNTAKVAWYVANSGTPDVDTLTDGINSDEKFTGSWNVEIIPNRIVDSDTNRFNVGVGRSNGRPVIGYSNNQSGSKGIEYLTRTADLED